MFKIFRFSFRDLCNHYTVIARNAFYTIQEKSDKNIPNDEYENFVITYIEAVPVDIPNRKSNIEFSLINKK